MKSTANPPKEFDIYDFDKTAYKGDCSLDFYRFCVRKNPLLLIYLPYQVVHLSLFLFKLEDRTSFKEHFFVFLRGVKDATQAVEDFWKNHYQNIQDWYRDSDHAKDIIISASPEFLLGPAAKKIKVHTLIATRMDSKTGKIEGKNCRGEEKVARLRQALGEVKVRKVYTDSLADMPLLALAKEKYIVKGDQILTLQEYAKLPHTKNISIPDSIEDAVE